MKQLLACICAVFALALHAKVERVFRAPRFERGMLNQEIVQPIDEAAWIWHPGVPESQPPCADIGAFFKSETGADAKAEAAFLRFRREFDSDGTPFSVDVSADERFVLFLDGELVARGPNRGWTENWQYQTYELRLPVGRHVMEAVVWRGREIVLTPSTCEIDICGGP